MSRRAASGDGGRSIEQALIDAEVLRAQAELTHSETRVAYDAARQTLLSAEQALAASLRNVEALRLIADGLQPSAGGPAAAAP